MDRRSWPWKKKSSEKNASADSAGGNRGNENTSKDPDCVTISKDMHAHFLRLEDHIQYLENELNSVSENLSAAQSDLLAKENLVNQHAKVAEEAVSGWEKTEAEALGLKNQVEAVTLERLTAEDRAAHLDGALKECMKQIRLIKEESEQQLQDVIFAKTQQWENIRFDLDSRIVDLEQELLQAAAENEALSRSLQERAAMLVKIGGEKSQAEAEIEALKTAIQSREKEIGSLKYEVHIVTKELEIRNEEKNMSLRSADVANKQHLDDVKKIAKLDAECQRLRTLVRKRLPGPAALAQMRQEVEVEVKVNHPPPKGQRFGAMREAAWESLQQYQKENEFLTARLLAMEEETKMLKEALSKRNSELQTARNMCAKTSSKLRSLETQMLVVNRQSPSYAEAALSQNGSNPLSLTSMSEDGLEEQDSFGESWSTTLISNAVKPGKVDNAHDLELLDDFLEMERLACLSSERNATSAAVKRENEYVKDLVEEQVPKVLSEDVSLSELQSRIASMVKAQTKNGDMGKLLEDIKGILLDVQEECPVDDHSSPDDEALKNAVSLVHEFVLSACGEAVNEAQRIGSDSDSDFIDRIRQKAEELTECFEKSTVCDTLIVSISGVLCEIKEWRARRGDKAERLEKQGPSNLQDELDKCKVDLVAMEKQMEELKSMLEASKMSTGLAETQLKCMTESYKSMEVRARELEAEVNRLQTKVERLEEELQQERLGRREDLARYKNLEEQMERNQLFSTSAVASDADADVKINQGKEIAAAAEKLAECQETILLLGRQLQALHPPAEHAEDSLDRSDGAALGPGRRSFQLPDPVDRCGGESPLNGYAADAAESSPIPRSPINSRRPKSHRSPAPSSSSSGSSSTPEKHGRSFTRFFAKGKRDCDAPPSS